jgi:Fe2+ transport system protein B
LPKCKARYHDFIPGDSWRTHITDFLNRPIPGTIGLFVVMAIVFQAVFAWATPLMDLIDAAAATLGAGVIQVFGEGAVSSLIADGIIAGVGSVVIFLPQILILFLFIILLSSFSSRTPAISRERRTSWTVRCIPSACPASLSSR